MSEHRPSLPLRITVAADDQIDPQARAYAEYRVFGRLAPAHGVRAARVTLRPARRRPDAIECAVLVEHADGRCERFRATGAHTYDAINKAAERLQEEMTVSS